jgi:hypothetical protein
MNRSDCRQIRKSGFACSFFYSKKVPVEWNGRYETPAGKACPRQTPQAVIKEEEILVMAF